MASENLLLLPIIFLLFHPSDMASTPPTRLVQHVCGFLDFYDLCVSVLQSDTRTATADMPELCEISFDLTRSNYTGILAHIDDLSTKITDPKIKACLESCHHSYVDGQVAIDMGKESLSRKDYEWTYSYALSARGFPTDCGNWFKQKGAQIPELLAQDNQVGYKLGVIGETISSILWDN